MENFISFPLICSFCLLSSFVSLFYLKYEFTRLHLIFLKEVQVESGARFLLECSG